MSPRYSQKSAAPYGLIEPLEDRIAPADLDIALINNTLTLVDGAQVGHDDRITISGGVGGIPLTITDPGSLLSVTGIPTAVLSVDQHTVTIPAGVMNGVTITVSTLEGNDTLTLDYSAGVFANSVSFFGGNNAGVGDKLAITGGNFDFATLSHDSASSGSLTLFGAGLVTYSFAEAVDLSTTTAFLTLQYRSAAQTITLADEGGQKTTATSNSGVATTFTAPSTQLLVSGDVGDDTLNLNSIGAGFPARISLDGNGGGDTINVAAGLPTLPGLTLRAFTISTLPALSVGAEGLNITSTGGNIILGGTVDVAGPLTLAAIGVVSSSGTVKAQTINANGAGVTLTLDGGAISAGTSGFNNVTLSSVNNAPSLVDISPGFGTTNLASGNFVLGGDDAISKGNGLNIGGTLDLNGRDQALDVLGGIGTVTNTTAALSTLTLGSDASFTFSGRLQGNIALEKTGTSELILAGANVATGGTTIRLGKLVFAGAGNAINGPITLAGGTLAYGTGGTFGSDIIVAADSSIEVAMGDVLTLTDLITGPGGLTKLGGGTLILANALNSFGPSKVQIKGGVLQVASDGALGDVGNDIEINEATLSATAGFASGRNFTNTGGTATIDAQLPTLMLINKAIVQGDFVATNPANLKFALVYADNPGNTPEPDETVTVGNTTVSISGGGSIIIHKENATTIDTIELTGATSKTKLVIKAVDDGSVTIVKRIVIENSDPGTDPEDIASIGSITLGKNVQLGDGVRDSVPDLYVEGKAGKLSLYDIQQYALLRLGDGLLYDDPANKKTPDTYNNKPDLKIHNVLGPGVTIDLTPSDFLDNLNRPIGGGGLGKVEVNSWASSQIAPGFIRTTQSLTSFKLLEGDCFVVFNIDKFHVGEATTANVGSMTIPNGSWGSSGSEIEGDIGSFSAAGFLAGATLTAASMGKVGIDDEAFAGLLRLTDPDAPGIPTFTVNSDFSGVVESAAPLRKMKIKGDFMGSLQAPFIGSISAYSFVGGGGDGYAIHATDGGLGTLTASAGVVKNFSIVTEQAFKGFNIKLGKLTNSTVGIDNVHIQAASIGNITVNLSAAATASGIDLIGIRNSEFITTGEGTTKTTAGHIGNVTVTLTGATGGANAIGIENSQFNALSPGSSINTIGKIAVKVTGQGGSSLGLKDAAFSADILSPISVSVSKGKAMASTAYGIENAEFFADSTIGSFSVDGDATSSQVHFLGMYAGGNIGAVTVKAKNAQFGTLNESDILAGQELDLDGATSADVLAALAKANLGAVTVTGSIQNTMLVAGSAIGAVTVGKNLTDSLIIAGALLGDDLALGGSGGGMDIYQRAASIAAITVKGGFGTTSIAAGVNPGNTIFGDTGDSAAAAAVVLTKSSFIGAINIAAPGVTSGTAGATHAFAIKAAAIKSLKLGTTAIALGTNAPVFLDTSLPAGETGSDVLVALL